ncbi:hypothetical protein EUTSA_v10016052mg [Eutrema salsugineum]|uniref:Uncharacterized protein n=1 Tax=Eutrema salsugineum TaxID=72664 RepID=V4LLU3_EUTSA|nr:uncharacterized protein LOC18018322 [Eutrema salsugineum]ESQ43437.1 hypothetical protein EUTSA_v10016052mg [Eutrema salsugineum]
MIGRDGGSIPDGDLTAAESRVSASLPCLRKNIVEAGMRDIFYGEDDGEDWMFREEVEQDTVMRAYRSDEAMRSFQNTRLRRRRRTFFGFECFDFLRLFFSRNQN